MKYLTSLVIIILLDISAGAISLPVHKYVSVNNEGIQNVSIIPFRSVSFILSHNIHDLRMITGRKITLKERIALLIIKHQVRKHGVKTGITDKGKIALILGLIGAVFLLIPFLDLLSIPLAIVAIVMGSKAKEADPRDKKARWGMILGIATLGILVTVGIIVAIVLTKGWMKGK